MIRKECRNFHFTTAERVLNSWLEDYLLLLIYLGTMSCCALKPGKIFCCWFFCCCCCFKQILSSSVPMLGMCVRSHSAQHSSLLVPYPCSEFGLYCRTASSLIQKNTLIHIGKSPFLLFIFSPLSGIRENRFFHIIALGLLCDCFSC